MNSDIVQQLIANLGVAGPLVVYLIWREQADRKQRAAEETARNDIQKEDIASREKLAGVLAGLSMAITGRPNV